MASAWGGVSTATTRALEALHQRHLLRVARRDKGIRVYEVAPPETDAVDPARRLRDIVMIAARIFAPAPEPRLRAALAPLRRRGHSTATAMRTAVDELVTAGALERSTVDGVDYLWPAARGAVEPAPRVVRFLAPFDPVVWDRERFEHLWGWSYRFEAYTPRAKRVRGRYAMPLLWGDAVIGWANATDGARDVDVGFVDGRPGSKAFATQLDAEVERLRVFLLRRG